jgi:predicted metal-dependent HD superfamily phosphohydrolase
MKRSLATPANPPSMARRRWRRLWISAGGDGGDAVLADLRLRYAEPGRAYHTLRHVLDCLRSFDRVRRLCSRPAAVELALWFHDAVYDPHALDNEALSADLLRDAASRGGVDTAIAGAAADLVLATAHFAGPAAADGDAAVIRDIDLAILGARRRKYAAYERRVRREYADLSDEQWTAGRAAVLAGFLSRPTIYSTTEVRGRLELRARRNLARSLARLRRTAPGAFPTSPPPR